MKRLFLLSWHGRQLQPLHSLKAPKGKDYLPTQGLLLLVSGEGNSSTKNGVAILLTAWSTKKNPWFEAMKQSSDSLPPRKLTYAVKING